MAEGTEKGRWPRSGRGHCPRGLTMGLLKAVCLDSMLAHLASARLLVRRWDLVLWVLWTIRTLWWLPMLLRRDGDPPLGSASSESESASWYLASRRAVGRETRGGTSRADGGESAEPLPPPL